MRGDDFDFDETDADWIVGLFLFAAVALAVLAVGLVFLFLAAINGGCFSIPADICSTPLEAVE